MSKKLNIQNNVDSKKKHIIFIKNKAKMLLLYSSMKPSGSRRTKYSTHKLSSCLLTTALLCGVFSSPLAADSRVNRLKSFSLEDLADVKVTIAGKVEQKTGDIAAAVFVISQEDIRHSGATNIPEALRLVPGMNVARLDANKWAVSSRGFNSRITNKLLVMIDGRSIYSPLFGGVMWDEQDIMLENIERIEIIRGPGGAVWGANAVNGVINIISKKASDTQGTLLSSTVGTQQSIHSIRRGGALSENAYYRLYAKYHDQDDSTFLDGSDANDNGEDLRAGFRVDWQQNNANEFTLQGGVYQGDLSEDIQVMSATSATFTEQRNDKIDTRGANLLGRWKQTFDNNASGELQIYFDYTKRDQWVLEESRNTLDIDYKYHLAPSGPHDIIWGLGYRLTHDNETFGDRKIGQFREFSPQNRTDHLLSGFIQDDITLWTDKLWLTLGSKVEHNDYSGFEIQPSVRLRWKPRDSQMIWGAVSRAVRIPTRSEHDASLLLDIVATDPIPIGTGIIGDSGLESEELITYELGYKYAPNAFFNLNLDLFYNDYENLRSLESPITIVAADPITAIGIFPTLGNNLFGETYGVELSAKWQPTEDWKLTASYSFLEMQLHTRKGSVDNVSEKEEGNSPNQQLNLLSVYRLNPDLTFSLFGRYVDKLPSKNVKDYVELDAGLEWKVRKDFELSLVGRNLLNDEHTEFIPSLIKTTATKVERELYLKAQWHF